MTSLADINLQIEQEEQKIAQLKKQAKELHAVERGTVIEEVRKQIAEYGITAADLKLAASKGSKGGRPIGVPKYRNANGETWSGGRGRKPRWVVDVLAAGKSLSEFEI
ncbi:H-NS histone family protein [Variovorax guangxiensis]|uniref:H-NS histone family protein n=1 Tax=Variovorax guangxiensis TaxID=1775474 RepID=A0A3S0ZDW9_9BURK|nr:H-NS histone family protein [Variovorax guangxiensis]RUR70923.1 H-NS histone family protein [Variovorax guangxiensis]